MNGCFGKEKKKMLGSPCITALFIVFLTGREEGESAGSWQGAGPLSSRGPLSQDGSFCWKLRTHERFLKHGPNFLTTSSCWVCHSVVLKSLGLSYIHIRIKHADFPRLFKRHCFPQSSSRHQQVRAKFSGLFPHFISLIASRLVHLESKLLVYAQSSTNRIKMQNVWYFFPTHLVP